MARTETNVVVGVDIGTSGISAAVFNTGFGAKQELTGVGYSPSIGIENGAVTDSGELAGSIRRTLADAELSAGVEIKKAYVSFDLPGMAVQKASVVREMGRKGLNLRDINEVKQKLHQSFTQEDYLVIQLTGVRYYIDNEPVRRPEHVRGKKFEAAASLVTVPAKPLETMQSCLELSGLKVQQFVAGPLAAAETVLTGAEKELGVFFIDVGAGLTKAACFNHGIMDSLFVFPVGCDHIIADLAVGLHTTLDEARSILIKYGLKDIEGYIELADVSGLGRHGVPGDLAGRIIKSRAEEILGFVRDHFIENLQLNASLPGGVVLTGGCALLEGFAELAGFSLNMPARVGVSKVLPPRSTEEEAYKYTGAIGVGLWGARQIKAYNRLRYRTGGGIFKLLTKWR